MVTDEADNCGTPVVAFVSDATSLVNCVETITRTYSVTDACNNSITVTQLITRTLDNTPPTASNPATINLAGCNAAVPAPDITVVTDAADNCGTPVVAFVSDATSLVNCVETTTRTYSVTDACNNTINVTQLITRTLDNTPPTASDPAPINLAGCNAAVPAPDITVVTDEADNCGTPVVAFVSDATSLVNCVETITRIYSVTDACNNTINVTQIITRTLDNTPPTASNPAPINLAGCNAAVPAPDITVVTDAADNCGTPVVAFVSDATSLVNCVETTTRTYSVTDACNNTINVTQLITRTLDNTPPTASNPAPINLAGCNAAVPAPDITVVTDEADNCGIPVVAFVSDATSLVNCVETTTRTYSVTDACNNTINVTQIITRTLDNTPPTASDPAPINLAGCNAAVPAPDITVVTDEADNCGTPVVAFVSDATSLVNCVETITRIYSVTDACNNTINVTQIITRTLDNTPPTASDPAPINLAGCNAAVPAPDITVVTDAADNCGTPVVAFVSDATSLVNCVETITRIYSVTDACNNTINVTQIITRTLDNTPPTASDPAPINLAGCNAAVPAPDITVVTDAADNCGTPVVAFVSDATSLVNCVETTTRTYSVTDACNNSITVTQLITRTLDNTPPTASDPAPINLAGCNAAVPAPDITVVTDEADNCGTPVVAFVSDATSLVNCVETITRIYSVTDACNNTINVTQIITRTLDNTPPTASNPAPINLAGCNAAVPAPDITVVTDAADNCGTPVVAFVSDATSLVNCVETTTRTYSVTDACNNTINVTQLITRTLDNTPPTASNPAPINLAGCNAAVPAPDITVVTDEADNCGIPVVAFVSDATSLVNCVETTTRTYSVTDACNNTINVTQIITRTLDNTPPTASDPAPINLAGCNAAVPAPDITVVTDEADNCGTPVVAFVSDATSLVNCVETITRIYSVTDACNNTINVTQIITRTLDNTPPTASDPAPINLAGCNAAVPAPDITVVTDAADNCGTPVVAFVSDATSLVNCVETITRTYSVTDACNNTINVTQIITRTLDNTPPTASDPAPINLAGCNAAVPAPDITVVTDEADNCGIPVVAFVSDATSLVNCVETTTRTYSVTDACNNTINVTQIITRTLDNTPPTASDPAPINLAGCNAAVPAPDITVVTDAADNCGTPVVAFVSDATSLVNCVETITRIYSVTDACNNTINVTQIITRTLDNTPPTASDPAPINLAGCNAAVPAPDISVVTDAADNCGIPVVAFVSDATSLVNCVETITRTYSVTDACNNTINVTQIITRTLDNTPPTASDPAPINLTGCNAAVPAPDITVVTDEADNCGIPVVAFVSDATSLVNCVETTTRTYSVTDACNNTINVTQIITRTLDNTPPTASDPAPINLAGCNAAVPAPDITVVTDEADNCGTPVVAFVSDATSLVNCVETITRIYSVTDACNNTINVTQIITRTLDNTPPTASDPAPINLAGCNAAVPAPDITVVTDAADNCGTPVVAFVSDATSLVNCVETITRTYSVTDACNNSITVTQLITRTLDNTPPTASNPAPINLAGCNAAVPAPDITVVTDEADNCGIPVVAFVSDATSLVNCVETTTRTYSVTDACNNTINVTQIITRTLDNTPPTASDPAPINLAGCNAAVPAPDITVVTDEADNCGTPVVAFVSDATSLVNCVETITRIYSVTDACNNTINVTQIITRTLDNTPPTASDPAPINLAGCNAAVPAPDITVVTDAADNCGTPVVAFVSDATSLVNCVETITRTYSVTDACNNTINVTQIITRTLDNTPPTASDPAPINLAGCNATVPAPDITVVTDAADNCGIPVVAFVSDATSLVNCVETTTRTYSVTDACNNTINVTQIITRTLDNTPPTASDPAPINLAGCNAAVPAPDITVVTDAADNCGTPVVAFVSDATSLVNCVETITRIYSVTDACNNTINVTQIITRTLDNTPPTASDPAPINLAGCNAAVPAPDISVVTDAADNCGTPVVAFVSDATSLVNCVETITRTYSVTDACNNTINVTQIITRTLDNTPPTASDPAPINLAGCNATVPAPDITVVTDAADNCGIPVVTFVSDATSLVNCVETTTRTYSVTDACNNTINVTQIITRTLDNTPPTASDPAPINLAGCNAAVPAPDITVVIDAADNCGTPVVAFVSDATSLVNCVETITRIYSVTDACNNTINVTQIITRTLDNTPPTASDPAPINLAGCNAAVPAPDITVVTDAADNCGTPVVAFVSDATSLVNCVETITRTYSVTDACNNTINVTQIITRTLDNTPPTASDPAPINLAGCNAAVPAPDITVVTDEADNCGIPVVAFVSDATSLVNCVETTTRTYSVTDACNNTINVTQLITRTLDNTPPTASDPAPINLAGCNATVPAPDITVVTDAADNCGIPVVTFVSDATSLVNCVETTTRTYSVTDACNNTINVTQIITRTLDNTPPTASDPAPINLAGCNAAVPAPDITVVTDEADNCGTPVVAFVSDATSLVNCVETITRIYSVTDACNNTINVTQIITRTLDNTPPTASDPAAINLAGCNAAVPAPDITVVTDEADNCGTPVVAFVSDATSLVNCVETITRIYSVTDACNNTINVTQIITRTLDNTPPTASDPAPINLAGCNAAVPAPDISVVTDAADNCGIPVVAFVSDATSLVNCVETITRTYSVTDACNNTINVTQIITRTLDNTPPTASDPAPINLAGCNAAVPAPDITVVTDAADNCGTPVVAFVSDATSLVNCVETITRTYSVTDACNNTINVTQIITRTLDNTPPTASDPAPINLAGCNATVPAPDITVVTDAADNCGTPVVAFVSDATSLVNCVETTTRTYSVTDACNNTINVTQLITRTLDNTPPTASDPAPINLAGCNAAVPAPDITVVTDEADNCGTPVVAFVSDATSLVNCVETITRIYSVTDACNNTINVTQIITRTLDNTPPTASNPAPINLAGCNAAVPAPDITVVTDAADNCGTPVVAFVSDATSLVNCVETTTRTYSVTDACNNTINVTQIITRTLDNTPPTASNPATINLAGCNAALPVPDIAVVTDEADNCGIPIVAFVSDATSLVNCVETTTRTYSVTDACNNTINVTQIITRTLDNTPPTASDPAPINLAGCNAAVPAPDITVVTDEADNCGTPVVAFVSDATSLVNCVETITRIYSVTDACNNTINVTQIITRTLDNTPPTASNPAAINLAGCNAAVPAPDITVVTDAADNCGTPVVAFVSDATSLVNCVETTTRTYSVTDACNNTINVTQIITRTLDNTPPTASNPATINLAGCNAALPVPDIAVVTDEADNCGIPIVAFVSDATSLVNCVETTTRTYSVTDACNNTINVTQIITRTLDNTPPTASDPAPINLAGCNAAVPAPDITVVTDEADNCGTPVVAFVSDATSLVNCVETITRIYSVTDACNNTINVTQIITRTLDNTPPTASNPAAINLAGCNAAVPVPDITVVIDAADNCGIPVVAFVSDATTLVNCIETTTRTYSVTDACNNTINVIQLITRTLDNISPTATNPAPLNLAGCNATVPAPDVSVVTNAADNCGNPVVAFVSDATSLVNCVETTLRTYSVTDACNNSITVVQTITRTLDVTPPVVTCPADVEVCEVPGNNYAVPLLTATDDCSGAITTSFQVTGATTRAGAGNDASGVFNTGVSTIQWTITDACGNVSNCTTLVTINPLPVIVIDPVGSLCIDGAPITLTANPTGGTFSGPGITGDTFDPGAAGLGTHTITYSYTDANGCTGTNTTSITVNPLPVVTITPVADLCVNAAVVTLNANPTGGTFSGPGVVGNTFDPAAAGPGTHTIDYTYTDGNGCTGTNSIDIIVNALPVITITPVADLCANAAPVTLTANPTGGTFSGTGVTGSTFNPITAGPGPHIISYTYTDPAGCTATETITINVNPLPVVDAGTYPAVCMDGAAITLAGTPTGGTFSGTGVVGTTFDPNAAGPGTHTITYTFTDGNGCTNSNTTTITVNPLPVVTITPVADLCVNAAVVTLNANPTGGTFSGPGVVGNTFDPAAAGPGIHTIDYTYTDGNGCTGTNTTTITVNALPAITITPVADLCANAAPVTLTANPTGGTFSGTGVSGSTFNPVTAGPGPHIISYSYTDPTGCTATETITINVNPLPVVDAGTYPAVCVDGGAITLAGTPTGGTFSGTGVVGNTFDPNAAGPGTHTITYTFTDGNGCTNSNTTTITVNPLPVVTITPVADLCVNAAVVTLNANPTGGTFSGPGVVGNTFDPAAAGPGIHTIDYTYTDGNGCTGTNATTITVNALPAITITPVADLCVNAGTVTLTANPTGGTFSGTGVSGSTFNPVTAGPGPHIISYSYTDPAGCTATETITINVNPLPVVDAGTYPAVCVDAGTITLAGTPTGGTFSGTGVVGTTFDPNAAGPGTHTITYTFTDGNGCTNSNTTTITVNALPIVTITPVADLCVNAAPANLIGNPAGGTFSGAGVVGNTFDPAAAGPGPHTIDYTYTDGNGCTGTSSITITVNALPVVDAGTYPDVCVDGAIVTLLGSPAGGTFSGTGVVGTSFNPATAGAGTFTVTYTFTDAIGCTGSATATITVNGLPAVDAGSYPSTCLNSAPITLNGTPAGGTFSGAGVTGNTFDPSVAGVGIQTITYSYTDGNGCLATASTTITVNSLPTVDAGTYPAICVNAAVISLAGSPSGGTFSGTGVSGNTFDPNVAGPGSHTINYSYTDGNGCTGTGTTTIVVNDLPIVDAGTYSPVCVDGGTITLNGNPSGGSFSGTGVVGNTFNPLVAGPGTHAITYSFTNANGCTATATTTITVNSLPVVDPGTYPATCVNSTSVTLNGTPSGGTFSGPGVTGSTFNPTTAGAGTHTIVYTYTDGNGCTNTSQTTITVNALPVVDAGTYPDVCENGAIVVLAGNPGGGTFSGAGVTGNNFDPNVAGVGNQTITYTYTDGNGCTGNATTTIQVLALPTVSAGTYPSVCINGASVTLAGIPAGGTFTGSGVTGTSFDPSIAGVGTHTITYNYSGAGGCGATATTTITVNDLPVVDAGTYPATCIDGGAITLTGTPTGGTFSGVGVSGNSFNPNAAGLGTHIITYSYTDGNGCTATATASINVNNTPVVNAGTYGPVCVDGTTIVLAGSPSGGTFSGTGVTGSSFNPVTAGVGSHIITYTYNDGNGCTGSAQTTIVVNDLPNVSAGNYPDVCIDAGNQTLSGSPSGGTFTGVGVSGNTFNPGLAGIGNHTITYSYSDANGCGATATTTISVNALPTVSAGTYPDVCLNGPALPLTGNPGGGNFTGAGVSGNSFDPSNAGVGTHVITYTYTDGNGCSNSATTSITVNNVVPSVSISSTTTTICAGGSITFTALPVNGGPSPDYQWQINGVDVGPNNSVFTTAALVDGDVVTVIMTSNDPCADPVTANSNSIPIVSTTVDPAVTINTPINPICAGNTATFTAIPVNGGPSPDYQWQINGANAGTNSNTFTPASLTDNDVVTVIMTSNDPCASTPTATSNQIIITTTTTTPTVSITGNPTSICPGGSITFTATSTNGGSSPVYQWQVNGTNVGMNSTTYTGIALNDNDVVTVTMTSNAICATPAVVTSNQVIVDVTNAGASVSITPTTPSICVGGSQTFTANPVNGGANPSYQWQVNGIDAGTNSNTFTTTSLADNDVVSVIMTSSLPCASPASTSTTVNVNPLPLVSTGNYPAVCVNAASLPLSGSPSGGTFSGTGVTGSSFNPGTAGIGSHVITYDYTDANGCSASATATINVNGLPVVDAGTYPATCVNGTSIALVGTPGGGTFSGPGVSGSTFDPAIAGVGNHTITYDYTDGNGCTASATTTISVNALLTVDAGSYPDMCIDAGTVTLSGSPSGGAFSGNGVIGNTFNPITAGAGTHTITYNYTDPNGCSATDNTTITVNPLPVLNAGTYPPLCIDAPNLTLSGTPAGGTFNGPGVSGTTFNPALAGAGAHTIAYSFTDNNGCSASTNATITVNALPIVDAGTYPSTCIDAAVITLTGTPGGGTFSGAGVSGSTFDPALAGAGTHTITYNYTDGNGCSASATTSITVNTLPTVDAGTYPDACINEAPITLNGSPSGGLFSGPGVAGTTFTPSVAGAGTHTISYTFTDANGCSATASTTIVVNSLPVIDAGTYASICIDAGNLTLAGSPAGGTFSGPGVTGTTFNPVSAGAGTHTITYTFTDGNGCSGSVSTTITVNALPIVDAGTYPATCINAATVALTGTPGGGAFTGPGVSGTTFDPAIAGVGTHTIVYNYTDGNGCSVTVNTTITVNALPIVDAGTYPTSCINSGTITLIGSPAAGLFSGPGVSGTTFDPAIAGAGTHTITYSFTDANGCSATDNTTITVNALPIVDAGTYPSICIDAANVPLIGSPSGGTFSGTGVAGTTFSPSIAGPGLHNITYTYTDGNGCTATTSTTITVNALPVVDAGTYPATCINAAVINLVGTPGGGTFSGPGVSGTTFDPALAGAGTHTITYTYTDGNGCSATANTTISVNSLPVVDAGTYPASCINAGTITLIGTPAGGTFAGPGVSGTTFDPAIAGAGIHTITYSFTDANGCSATDNTTITVNALPVVDAGTYPASCINAATITLIGTPAGGTFSGPGVSGTTFDPALAGAGIHTITYSFTDANGCSATANTTITVNALPVVDAGTYPATCINAAVINLVGTPGGGTFSGPGVSGTTFDPALAGAGTHTITYTYIDGNGCSATANTTISVNALPVVDAGTYPASCINAGTITLIGTPAGGTFAGPGVSGTTFDPTIAGAGIHTITYSFTDANGCSATDNTTITVNALPVVDAGTYPASCINAATITLIGTPAGGTFSGPGVSGTTFDPALAGAGIHTITYSFTDANGCIATANTTITVNALPVVDAGTYPATCINAAVINLVGTPGGGTFSGPGVSGTTFDPALAGAGTHTITYTYTDGNGCSATANTTISVNALPVVDAGTYPASCINAGTITLIGTPAGGTFAGPGVSGTTFDPTIAGTGIHTITYSFTDANGCSATDNTAITVNALPVVDAGTYPASCINAATITLIGTPAGGTFSGPGVSGTTFDPALAGAGIHTITYSFTDANGCSCNSKHNHHCQCTSSCRCRNISGNLYQCSSCQPGWNTGWWYIQWTRS